MNRRNFLKAPAIGILVPGVAGLESIYPFQQRAEKQTASHADRAPVRQQLHQDFITYAPGIEYFLLGNGDIQAAIQYCPNRSGDRPQSFLGLTIMDAERFSRKWSTFLFHPERGFERTLLGVGIDGKAFAPNPATFKSVSWKYPDSVPVVSLVWVAGECEVEEQFFVPSEGGLLFRVVNLRNIGKKQIESKVWLSLVPNFALFDDISTDPQSNTVNANGFTGMKLLCLEKNVTASGRYEMNVAPGQINPGETTSVRFVYAINGAEKALEKTGATALWERTAKYWNAKPSISTGNDILDHFYRISRTGLKSLVARSGKRDSGLWMYNMEWVRDDVMVAMGMLQSGLHNEAKAVLQKILEKSVGVDGRTIESSRWFGYDYTELDQNGELLYGVWTYLCWTGDDAFVKKYWKKLKLAANFPLQEVFRDKNARLLRNKREFWERSDSFGVEDGFELAYQFWVALGLEKAAEIADRFGDRSSAKQWRDASGEIKKVMLDDPKFRLIENGHFIKRRTLDGRWQQHMIPANRNSMPQGSPLATEERPECEPDSANVYPIIFGLVDPTGEVARNTLQWVEQLWNQRWDFGGYSRYNVSSEPDPPAPWPLASMFMARAYAEAGDSEKVWRVIEWLHSLHGGTSGGWFERYGPSITPPAPPVCVIGWTWAEIIGFLVYHLMGLRPGLESLVIRPKLLDGINELSGKFSIRTLTIDVALRRSTEKPYAIVNGKTMSLEGPMFTLPFPKVAESMRIEMYV